MYNEFLFATVLSLTMFLAWLRDKTDKTEKKKIISFAWVLCFLVLISLIIINMYR